ncbi:MAG TPA: LamG-like jellyroll fold domain-containing protein, partial [Pseudomonadales bacterium]|nr:LamG-like jellyroll fold domain-containing protein [Pseudomonadales bacterium]
MTTYHSKSSVSSSGNGLTEGTAFKTIQEGFDALGSGDSLTVYAGTYSEALTLPFAASGTFGSETTINFNAGVIIDGANTYPTGAWVTGSTSNGGTGYAVGSLWRIFADHIIVNGSNAIVMNSRGGGVELKATDPVTDRRTNVQLNNLIIHDCKYLLCKADESDDVLFNYITAYNGAMFAQFTRSATTLNWPNGMTMKDGDNMVITNCEVYWHWGEGIGIAGGTSGEIGWCTVHNTYGTLVYMNRSQNVTIHDNFIYHSGFHTGEFLRGTSLPNGLRFNNEKAAKQLHRPPNDTIKAYNNIVVGLGKNLSFGDQEGGLGHTDIWVYNNTFVNSVEFDKQTSAVELNSGIYTNVHIKNNIFHQYVNDARVDEVLATGNNNAFSVDFDNNIWYGNTATNMPDVNFRGANDFYGSSDMANPIIPLTAGSGDRNNYKIDIASDAINLGAATIDGANSITAPTLDIGGRTRVSNPDSGAWEYDITTASLTAAFTYTPATGDAPLTVNFTDTSTATNTITGWVWEWKKIADAFWTQFSTSQSPSYQFVAADTYSVRLTISNGDGSNTITKTNIITANAPGGGGGGVPSGTNLILNHDFATGDLTSWLTTGDVVVSSGAALMTGVGGTNTRLYQKSLSVTNATIYTLQFDASSDVSGTIAVDLRQHVSPLEVLGLDTTFVLTASPATYSVSFTATQTYSNARLRFAFSDAQVVTIDNVYLVTASLVPDFSGTPLTGDASLSVDFTDLTTSTSGIQSWQWRKRPPGGGAWTDFSTSQNPTESFTAETWDVQLEVTDANFTQTETKAAYIVSNAVVTVYTTALFDVTPTTGAYPLTVSLTDNSITSDTIVDWLWEYKASTAGTWTTHSTSPSPANLALPSTGYYDIRLTVTSGVGADTLEQYQAVYVSGGTALDFTIVDRNTAYPYTLSASTPLTPGEWHLAVCSYDGDNLRIYLDGAEIGTINDIQIQVNFDNSVLDIGQANNAQWFNGVFDEIFIMDEAIDPDLVRAVYESNAPVFAETNPGGIQNGNNRVRITDEGLYIIDQDSDPVFAVYCGDSPTGKAWGGLTLNTGDMLIGSATDNQYMLWDASAKTMAVRGSILIEGTIPWENISNPPTSLGDISPAEANKLAGIQERATEGADWNGNIINVPAPLTDDRVGRGLTNTGALQRIFRGYDINPLDGENVVPQVGLNMTATYMGYYDGTQFKTFLKNDGQFFFDGEGGANIYWDGTDLAGSDGSVVQWYARASTGKIYAGAGAVVLDQYGVVVVDGSVLLGADGVNILTQSTDDPDFYTAPLSLDFLRSTGEQSGRITGYYVSTGTLYGMDVLSSSPNTESSTLSLRAR